MKYIFLMLVICLFSQSLFSQEFTTAWGKESEVQEGKDAMFVRNTSVINNNYTVVRAGENIIAVDVYDTKSLNLLSSIAFNNIKTGDEELNYVNSVFVDDKIVFFAATRVSEDPFENAEEKTTIKLWGTVYSLNNTKLDEWQELNEISDYTHPLRYDDYLVKRDWQFYYDKNNKIIVSFDPHEEKFSVFDTDLKKHESFTHYLNDLCEEKKLIQTVISSKGSFWYVFLSELENDEPKCEFYLFDFKGGTPSIIKSAAFIPKSVLGTDTLFIDAFKIQFKIQNDEEIIVQGLFNDIQHHKGSYFFKYSLAQNKLVAKSINFFDADLQKQLIKSKIINANISAHCYVKRKGFQNFAYYNELCPQPYQLEKFYYNELGKLSNTDSTVYFTKLIYRPMNSQTNNAMVFEVSYQSFGYYTQIVDAKTGSTKIEALKTDGIESILFINYDSAGKFLWNKILYKTQQHFGYNGYNNYSGCIPFIKKDNVYLLVSGHKDWFTYRAWDPFRGDADKNTRLGYFKLDKEGTFTKDEVLKLKELGDPPTTSSYYFNTENEVYLLVPNSKRKKYRLLKISSN